jgi:hypothetical protein
LGDSGHFQLYTLILKRLGWLEFSCLRS